jgi:D-3-phosphoglycerate dehydrogenase
MAQQILIGPSSFGESDRTPLERLLASGLEIVENPFKRRLTREELIALLTPNVVGLIAGLEPLDADVLQKSNLKAISRVGSGMANVDVVAAKQLGIAVHSTPSGPTQAVAELTLGALLSLMRMISEMDFELHAGRWTKRIGIQLEGKTILIIGFGRIGRRLADLLVPFNVRLLVVDPMAVPADSDGWELVSLEQALPQADVISLHSSGEQQILGAAQFAIMKNGAILLNAARGALVDEVALVSALKTEKLFGAWVDTFSKEPYTGQLANFRNVVLTPHVGTYTKECRLQMETEAAENLLRGLKDGCR